MRSPTIFKAFLILAALQVSCMPSEYYQVYETTIDETVVSVEGQVQFETEQLIFKYDLWSSKGDAGFQVKNISNLDVTIDLTKTFYVRNDLATPYYSDIEISYSTGSSISAAVENRFYLQTNLAAASAAASASKTYKRPSKIVIPPNTYVVVNGFAIVSGYLGECNLAAYPSKNENAILDCDKDHTPLAFSNIISYEWDGNVERVEHKFYISRIENLPASKVFKSIDKDECGNALYVPKKVFAVGGPSSFYYRYVRR